MSSSHSVNEPFDIDLTEALKQSGVKRFSRQGALLRIDHSIEKNGKVDWTAILFESKREGFIATLKDFERNCQKNRIPRQTIQQIMAALSPMDDDRYVDAMKYYDGDGNVNSNVLGNAIKVEFGDFFDDENKVLLQGDQGDQGNDSTMLQSGPSSMPLVERTESHFGFGSGSGTMPPSGPSFPLPPPPPPSQSPEVESDANYPDDNGGLDLHTVLEVLQLDRPQPVRVIGLVDVIRTRFDLIKQIVLSCTTDKCPNRNKRETRTLKVGIFSVNDLPFVFPDGREALEDRKSVV